MNEPVLKQLLIMVHSHGKAACHRKVGRLWLIITAALFSISCGLAGTKLFLAERNEVFFEMKFSLFKN